MSHELRTPLNGILGYTQILNRDRSLTEKQQEGINIIHLSSEHLLTLINDILDLSKIEAGKLEIIPVDFHLPDFLQNIADLMKMRAEQKSIRFVFEILYQLPIIVHTDEKRLRQVLLNLLSNAVKFTEKGKVSFKIIYYEEKIRFEVEDTGMGVPTDQLEAIFLPFRQIGDLSPQMEGTGLGLSIARQLVEMMGGQLQVESLVGTGSIFLFEITLPEVQGTVNIKRTRQATIIGYKRVDKHLINHDVFLIPKKLLFTLLIVDDKWQNRAFLVDLLTDLGFLLLEANNGKEALDSAIEHYPDIILTDLVMPVMDGFELARKIRQDALLKNIVIFADSANVFEQHQRMSLEAGCNEFIGKPIRTDILLDLLQKHLPLEWVYDRIEMPDSFQLEPKTPLIGPSSNQASALFKLIRTGNIKKIIENAEELEQQESKLSPFAQRVKQLAKGFEMSKLKEIVKPYIS
jgi:CheY-like chemotaxis protein